MYKSLPKTQTERPEIVFESFFSLQSYCEKEHFKGYDPYDGLNSRLLSILPFSKNRLVKLAWIQFFKRSPFNFRTILAVPKDYNPQGLALFLSGYCNLYKIEPKAAYKEKIIFLLDKLLAMQSPGWSGTCWGYNFDWQARAFFQPKFSPTVVVTTFATYAILDAYAILKDEKLLAYARSACDFVLKDLNRTYDDKGNFAFTYSPIDQTVVFNASLLGSRLLARVYAYTQEEILISEARKSIEYCCQHQQTDGSWRYGTKPYHHWIDSYHTGYNLECIAEYQHFSKDSSFQINIDKGLKFYVENFFEVDGFPKNYHNKKYPVDINGPAQLLITLYRLNKLDVYKELADNVLQWTIQHMQHPKGYFYYQLKKGISSKIPYMRWANAWMFNAMSFYLLHHEENSHTRHPD
ncbi:MAG: delta-aminolevulinic acid dehydratase [Verrucomicrobia bacterium]|nr:delta-aminolevulinic acid dehydratase [Cytophagales bacterium]